MSNTYIIVKTQFEALHHWPDVPKELKEVQFLKDPHRHIFHVTLKWLVSHDDRDKEFISYKRSVTAWIREHWEGKFIGAKSCEMMARQLGVTTNAVYCKVMEDNENGSEWISSSYD